jgi:hypothetical protein
MSTDQEFEAFLRGFRPLAGAPLPRVAARRPRSRAWLAAAAALLAAAGLWWQLGPPRPASSIKTIRARASSTWGALRDLSGADPLALEMALERNAQQDLPDVARRDGALRLLARFQNDL